MADWENSQHELCRWEQFGSHGTWRQRAGAAQPATDAGHRARARVQGGGHRRRSRLRSRWRFDIIGVRGSPNVLPCRAAPGRPRLACRVEAAGREVASRPWLQGHGGGQGGWEQDRGQGGGSRDRGDVGWAGESDSCVVVLVRAWRFNYLKKRFVWIRRGIMVSNTVLAVNLNRWLRWLDGMIVRIYRSGSFNTSTLLLSRKSTLAGLGLRGVEYTPLRPRPISTQ
jgi:hypothetical protein